MKTIEQIADTYAHTVEAYQDSAEEVGHPEGQPIVETYPQLQEIIAAALTEDRKQIREALERPHPVPGFRDYPLATVDALLDAWEGYDSEFSVFVDAWNDYTAGINFPCPEHPAGLHQVTDGSCDLCGALCPDHVAANDEGPQPTP